MGIKRDCVRLKMAPLEGKGAFLTISSCCFSFAMFTLSRVLTDRPNCTGFGIWIEEPEKKKELTSDFL